MTDLSKLADELDALYARLQEPDDGASKSKVATLGLSWIGRTTEAWPQISAALHGMAGINPAEHNLAQFDRETLELLVICQAERIEKLQNPTPPESE